jgi:hypothetical protein
MVKNNSTIHLLQKLIKEFLVEEIGRNYHTIDNNPYSWKDYPGIHVDMYPTGTSVQWYAQVLVDFNDELSTPLRIFGSREGAEQFARNHVEKANQYRLSHNINTATYGLTKYE